MSLKHFAWACAFFAYGCFSPDSPSPQTGTDTDVDSDGTSDSLSTGSAVTSVTNASMSSEPSSTSPTQPTTSETMTTGPETDSETASGSSGVEPACGDGVPVANEFCFDDPPLSVDVGPGVVDVAIGDTDINGELDILTLHRIDEMGEITLIEADGVGGFAVEGTSVAPAYGGRLRVADTDGDGDDDVFAVGGGGLMHLRNEGSFLSDSTSMDFFSGDGEIAELIATDLNNDDIVDCVVTQAYDHSWYAGQLNGGGDWTFAATANSLPTSGEGASGMIVSALSYDGDEDLDVIALNQYYFAVEVLAGDGAGAFTLTSSPELCPSGARFGDAADFNGDGNTDFVATCMDGDLGVAFDDGTGTFATLETLALAGAYRPTVADFDRDGAPDILVTSVSLNRAVIFRNDGAGGLAVEEPQFMGDGPVYGAATADLDDDGALDIVIATSNTPMSRVDVYFATP
jgi:hypothetical protein